MRSASALFVDSMRCMAFAVAVVFLSLSAAAAPVLQIDAIDGKLNGAKGVEIQGVLYDVSFQDGSCIAVFSGCIDADDFLHSTFLSAVHASNALRAQVFLDGPLGLFDTHPELTRGCTSTEYCNVWTPYQPFNGLFFANYSWVGGPTGNGGFLLTMDFSAVPQYTWAVWSLAAAPAVSAAPEPGTLALLLLGFAGLGYARHTRRLKADPSRGFGLA